MSGYFNISQLISGIMSYKSIAHNVVIFVFWCLFPVSYILSVVLMSILYVKLGWCWDDVNRWFYFSLCSVVAFFASGIIVKTKRLVAEYPGWLDEWMDSIMKIIVFAGAVVMFTTIVLFFLSLFGVVGETSVYGWMILDSFAIILVSIIYYLFIGN